MNLKWSKTLAVSCAAVMTFLIAIFYLSEDKTKHPLSGEYRGLPCSLASSKAV